MKTLSAFVLEALVLFANAADLDKALLKDMAEDRTRWAAHAKGAEAKQVFRVVDIEGSPVTNAAVHCSFRIGGAPGWQNVHGATDTNGYCVMSGTSKAYMDYLVSKDGFYQSRGKVNYIETHVVPAVIDGKWQPYGETRTVVLKKIKNLGQLTVPDVGNFEVRERKIPKFDVWLSFDLEKFDWNFPYGEGKCPDVLLRFHNRTTPYYYDFTDIMEISFTNNPYAGVYEIKFDDFSDMKTVYSANSNAVYKSGLIFVCEKTKGKKSVMEHLKKDSYIIFRTRTSVDEGGNLKSAHYGTIFGDWFSANDHMRITDGCFNPVENSCNIEDGYYLREAVKHYKDSDCIRLCK